MKPVTLGSETLVPISLLTVIGGLLFWAAGLAKDVQANAVEIDRLRANQSSTEAELFQRVDHLTAVLSEIQVNLAKTDTKLGLLVEYARDERRKGNNH